MKIGILTFHCAHNYGAVLQTYALQEKLKELGQDVYIIDYRPDYLIDPYKIFNIKKLSFKNPSKSIKYILITCLTFRRRILRHVAFNRFITNRLKLSKKKLKAIPPIFDTYIFGSDQIWNTKITNGFDKIFFGYFETKNDVRKIVYAASMRESELDANENDYIKNALNNFHEISLRENNLIHLIQPLTNKTIKNVLDPTLIINRSLWDKIAVKPKLRKRYVLVYQVSINSQTLRIANEIAKQIDGVVIQLSAWLSLKQFNIQQQCASPEEFIGWIKYAECIVTTSFHGTAFSIIFNRPFYTIKLNNSLDSRSESLLKKLELENRLISPESQVQITNIDYNVANKYLEDLKNYSVDYLYNSINN